MANLLSEEEELRRFNAEQSDQPWYARALPMEGRATILPFRDTMPGSVFNKREFALPGLLAEAVNAFTSPARSLLGTDPEFNPQKEAANMALNMFGGGITTGAALRNPTGLGGKDFALNAWHGTPHEIKGGFDINKVGTGEGAQVYGHGMYYGENRNTGQRYREQLSGKTDLGERPSDTAFIHAVKSFKEAGYPVEVIPTELKKAYKSITDKDIKLAIQAANEGNLYKVDIPDKIIPSMLHWDKPVPEEIRSVLSKKALEEFGSGFSNTSGERLYKDLVFSFKQAGSKNPPKDASQWLLNNGVSGIRYLDEGSRGWRMLTPEESTSGKYVVGKHPGGGSEQKYFDNLKDAQEYFNKNQTSNFVVFDPSTVKILEKNDIKIEDLLEKGLIGE